MELGLSIIIFLTIATAGFALGAAALAPASLVGTRLRQMVGLRHEEHKPGLNERIEDALEPLSRAVPQSPTEVSRQRVWLMQAGYREPAHLTIYLGLRVAVALAFVVMLIVTRWGFGTPLLFLALPLLGYMGTQFILKRMIKARQHRIRLSLPDALDLAIICIEAGLGLDQALNRVSNDLRHVHPALSDELSLVGLEMRAGKARADALRNLALRTGVDDVQSLVAVLIQTDRFGTSVAQALRVHSDSLRVERRQRAEEEAAKTTIKMVPVLVFFVFPSMFVVSLGPAVIQLVRVLMPTLEK